MKERPILFSGAMVRALLEGRKTQTRRILKQATGPSMSVGCADGIAEVSWLHGDGPGYEVREQIRRVPSPYGVAGDGLWVREAFGISYDGSAIPWTGADAQRDGEVIYRATFDEQPAEGRLPWKPSIHMPRWASRITLEVTGVRVERLQDINEADAMAEGAEPLLVPPDGGSWPHYEGYRALWERINGPDSWLANPFVWVIEFRRL